MSYCRKEVFASKCAYKRCQRNPMHVSPSSARFKSRYGRPQVYEMVRYSGAEARSKILIVNSSLCPDPWPDSIRKRRNCPGPRLVSNAISDSFLSANIVRQALRLHHGGVPQGVVGGSIGYRNLGSTSSAASRCLSQCYCCAFLYTTSSCGWN